jgi:S-adenosylmethionine decarboxylase
VLTTIPDQLGLERVGGVRTFHRDDALTGIALISESHFSIHVRPEQRIVHADLFSCRPFDMVRALDLLKTAYDFLRYEEQALERGRSK